MNDFRFATRQLLKNPGFPGVAVLPLALGIGVNSALFSVMYAALFEPLLYPEPDRLVQVQSTITPAGKPTETLPGWRSEERRKGRDCSSYVCSAYLRHVRRFVRTTSLS